MTHLIEVSPTCATLVLTTMHRDPDSWDRLMAILDLCSERTLFDGRADLVAFLERDSMQGRPLLRFSLSALIEDSPTAN